VTFTVSCFYKSLTNPFTWTINVTTQSDTSVPSVQGRCGRGSSLECGCTALTAIPPVRLGSSCTVTEVLAPPYFNFDTNSPQYWSFNTTVHLADVATLNDQCFQEWQCAAPTSTPPIGSATWASHNGGAYVGAGFASPQKQPDYFPTWRSDLTVCRGLSSTYTLTFSDTPKQYCFLIRKCSDSPWCREATAAVPGASLLGCAASGYCRQAGVPFRVDVTSINFCLTPWATVTQSTPSIVSNAQGDVHIAYVQPGANVTVTELEAPNRYARFFLQDPPTETVTVDPTNTAVFWVCSDSAAAEVGSSP